jgi:hypothetical protein
MNLPGSNLFDEDWVSNLIYNMGSLRTISSRKGNKSRGDLESSSGISAFQCVDGCCSSGIATTHWNVLIVLGCGW